MWSAKTPAKNGCPAAKDSDGDGVLDGDDKCPEQAGVAPDGCPDPDPDKDGVVAPDDKCPDVAETVNGFEDEDGCPDEVPQAVQKFSGVIGGIEFDLGKATIRAKSKPVLDEAVTVLEDYPALRIEVSGHTDNQGDPDKNRPALGKARRGGQAIPGFEGNRRGPNRHAWCWVPMLQLPTTRRQPVSKRTDASSSSCSRSERWRLEESGLFKTELSMATTQLD